jgi:hypothetical protein
MPLRRAKPVTFRPTGLSDAVDGSNAFAGAMQQLANLIPDPSTDKVWVCRPGAVAVNGFPGSLENPGFISGALVVGNILYGTIATALNPGYDQPFAFNLGSNTFLAVTGVTAGNVPSSPPSMGDWVPPILAQVGNRVIVCHPGFPGGPLKFGWFDVSGFIVGTTGNTTSGSPTITGAPEILGVQPGMTVIGSGIPAGATALSTENFVLDTTGTTNSNTTLNGLASTAGVAVGQTVAGEGIATGTTVTMINSSSSVGLSQAATASASGVAVTFSGATITLSANATATANGTGLTVTGGTPLAPQWGAGDTNINNLPSVPLGVAQFNGRAYFACGLDGIPFSDSGFPCQISNNPSVQVLLTNDGLPVTAIGPLPLNTILGGIVQALIAFEGIDKMQQITGDPATSNLEMNALPMATGTLSPLSLVPCSLGLAFISPQGLRYVNFSGQVSDVVGVAGSGVSVPFINAPHPSRTCAAANVGVLRIAAEALTPTGQPTAEYWYDLARKIWSGPHTFASSQLQAWGATFVAAQTGINGQVYQTDVYQSGVSVYTENGANLAWAWTTPPLPDTGDVAVNSLVDMTLATQLPGGATLNLSALDIGVGLLDQTTVAQPGAPTIWGQFIWGQAAWSDSAGTFKQQWINWHVPLVFKQLILMVTGVSAASLRIGNLYMRYQVLSYILQELLPTMTGVLPGQLLSDEDVPLTSDEGVPEVGL